MMDRPLFLRAVARWAAPCLRVGSRWACPPNIFTLLNLPPSLLRNFETAALVLSQHYLICQQTLIPGLSCSPSSLSPWIRLYQPLPNIICQILHSSRSPPERLFPISKIFLAPKLRSFDPCRTRRRLFVMVLPSPCRVAMSRNRNAKFAAPSLEAVGEVAWVDDEELIDAVTALSEAVGRHTYSY